MSSSPPMGTHGGDLAQGWLRPQLASGWGSVRTPSPDSAQGGGFLWAVNPSKSQWVALRTQLHVRTAATASFAP